MYQQAIAAESFIEPAMKILVGDVVTGFAQSDHIIEGKVRVGGQEHFYLETHTSIAVPKGEDGEMELFTSLQDPHRVQVCYGVDCFDMIKGLLLTV